jgi:DNA-binding IclR family transcriptional regulator
LARPTAQEVEEEGAKRLYTAPALEKGLDIMELLARETRPLTASAIVQRLGRSTGELFRMIQVLERRGFVAQGPYGYMLTSKLFEMGLERPPVRNLVEAALPVMRQLATQAGQSCHLVFQSGSDMVVVARMESQEQLGFSVRIGYRRPLHRSTSGAVLYAFQPPETRAEWEKLFDPAPPPDELIAFRQTSETVLERGYAELPSGYIDGLIDLSAPILRGDRATAALAVPFARAKTGTPKREVIKLLRAAVIVATAELVINDNRV